ncbi:competence protein CoiA family protein [Lactiplantibacillus plantarum]|nr:competence protein CoiA family protein [Lactiplantibacillus plantarum]
MERLAARTQGYRQHGYQVLWLLGRPYQRQLHLNSKALKFLQYQQRWGLFLLFWTLKVLVFVYCITS